MNGLKLNSVNLNKVSQFINVPNFKNEIIEFEKSWNKKDEHEKILDFPVNQERVMRDVLRTLATPYPNVVLTGNSGIGKSMTLDTIINVLTGKKEISSIKNKINPEIENLFSVVSDKLSNYHKYKNFLLLPDLLNNNNVKPIVFSSADDLDRNSDYSRIYSENIINFFDIIIPRNISKIKKVYPKKDFLTYLDNENSKFFQNLYTTINDILLENGYDENSVFPPIKINFNSKNSNNSSKQSLELKLETDFTDISYDDSLIKSFGIQIDEKDEINKKKNGNQIIEDKFLKSLVESQISTYFKELKTIKVDNLNSIELSKIIYSQFNSISKDIYSFINKFNENDDFEKKEYEFIKQFDYKYVKLPTFDQSTYDYISSNIKKISNSIRDKSEIDKNLLKWIDNVEKFFSTNKKSLDDMLNNYLNDIYTDINLGENKNKENPIIKLFFADKTYFPLSTIFSPMAFYGTNYEKVTAKNLENFNPNKSFFNFRSNENTSNPNETIVYAPHTKIQGLGDFFKADILYFKDSFKDVIKKIAMPARFEGEKPDNFKEKFLEFLQTNNFTYNFESANYEIYSPKMILAAGNEDAFNLIEDGYKEVREEGLEARINQVYVPDMVDNTKKTRDGTLEVIYSTIHKYNKDNNTDIDLDIDSVNYLLNTMILSPNLISVKYRDFTKSLENICNFAKFKSSDIDLELIKSMRKEDLTHDIYSVTDYDLQDIDGYNFIEDKKFGTVNGLAVTNGGTGVILRANSNIIYDKLPINNDRFNLVDMQSGMVDETTFKGFILAENYVKNYLSKIEDKELLEGKYGWKIFTQFHKNTGKIGGNSASTAIAASIISSLSQTPTFKKRFITGTLEPDGIVGAIGGVYEKGTVPARYKQLSNDNDKYSYMFPLANLQELNRELIVDPFELKSLIEMVPVKTFEQAYALLTTPVIDDYVLSNSHQLGSSILKDDLKKIETNLKQFYTPKKKFFFF